MPPDLGTRVLVIFAEGKTDQAFWIGCVQEPLTNHMTPGIASSEKTVDAKNTRPSNPNQREGAAQARYGAGQNVVDKKKTYGSENVPAGEIQRIYTNGTTVTASNVDNLLRPVHPFAENLAEQGLSTDPVRGPTSSSAQRETPSRVFGISTPGPLDTETVKQQVGTKDSGASEYVSRKTGHTFVMDDGDEKGDNQHTRIRTASGHQILMNDTEGTVYIANGSGKAYFEMEKNGKINVYSDRGIAIRAEGDFNLHADGNIQFHAKESIKFTSEQNLALNAEQYLLAMGNQGIFNSSQEGVISDYARQGLTAFTDGNVLIGSGSSPGPATNPNTRAGANSSRGGGAIHLSGPQVHFNSVPAQPTWGPKWLTPEHPAVGIIVTEDDKLDIEAQQPFVDGEPNKIPGRTTVMDTNTNRVSGGFVTHEPYDRTASKGREREGIEQLSNDATLELAKENPELQTEQLRTLLSDNPQLTGSQLASQISSNPNLLSKELNSIRSKLLKSNKVDAVINTLKNINKTSLGINISNQIGNQIQSKLSSTAIGQTIGRLTVPLRAIQNFQLSAVRIKANIRNQLANVINNKIRSGISALRSRFGF